MSERPLLEVRGLSVARGGSAILHGVDLELRAGEALALVGPNAAGKSTLVRAIMGLLPASAGEVLLFGRPLPEWPRADLARAVALVTAEEEGPDTLTVGDRVALGRYPHTGPFRPLSAADRSAVHRALHSTGIEELARRRLGTLSAGERQLATLARGLAQEPRVLLLDEPAAHLDIGHQLALFRVLDQARSRGVAVLAVIHDLQRAAGWADRLLLLAHGRVAADGPAGDVLGSAAASQAFHVAIREHRVHGLASPVYSFEEPPAPEDSDTA